MASKTIQSVLMQNLSVIDLSSDVLYAPWVRKFFGKKEGGKRILEVGAGLGAITRHLVEYGQVHATDISEYFLDRLKTRFVGDTRVTTEVCDATHLKVPKEKPYDRIVALNVLEHIEDDKSALKCWYELLDDGGECLVLVPNGQWLFSPVDAEVGHFRRYSRKELVRKMEAAGFKVKSTYYANTVGIIGWIINGLIRKKSVLPEGQLWLYVFLKPILSPIEWLFRKVYGLSVVVVGTKPQKGPEPLSLPA